MAGKGDMAGGLVEAAAEPPTSKVLLLTQVLVLPLLVREMEKGAIGPLSMPLAV